MALRNVVLVAKKLVTRWFRSIADH